MLFTLIKNKKFPKVAIKFQLIGHRKQIKSPKYGLMLTNSVVTKKHTCSSFPKIRRNNLWGCLILRVDCWTSDCAPEKCSLEELFKIRKENDAPRA